MKDIKDTKIGKILSSKGLNDVLESVGKVVPGIGAINALKNLALNKPELSEQDRAEIIAAAEQDLRELDMLLTDVQNARQREVELAKAGVKNYTQNALAFTGVGAFIILYGYVVIFGIKEVDTDSKIIIGQLLGTVGTIAGLIFGYYFGSSKGSREKNDLFSFKKS